MSGRVRGRRDGLLIAWLLLGLLVVIGYGLSSGAIATSGLSIYGHALMRAQLLTDAVAVTDGEWIDVSGLSTMSIDVRGIATATVEVDGSNEPTRPANNTHGNQLGSDVTANGYVHIKSSIRWLKVRVRTYASGTIQAYFEGRAD